MCQQGASLLLLRFSRVCFSTETELWVNTNFYFRVNASEFCGTFCFLGMSILFWFPKLTENERNHLKNYIYFLWQKKKGSVETAKMFSKERHLLDKWNFHKLNNEHRYTCEATTWEKHPEMAAFGIKMCVLWGFFCEKWDRKQTWSLPPPPLESHCSRFTVHLLKKKKNKYSNINMVLKRSDPEKRLLLARC